MANVPALRRSMLYARSVVNRILTGKMPPNNRRRCSADLADDTDVTEEEPFS
jgi:hypothetical protein